MFQVFIYHTKEKRAQRIVLLIQGLWFVPLAPGPCLRYLDSSKDCGSSHLLQVRDCDAWIVAAIVVIPLAPGQRL
ncbi:hypothetical protein Ahy_A07g033599 isoform B [Arachis hypogaea]|uniref:Uncharacterized protein n=1 Tax=Arachis hypogaea TaxID=3818 RepID=A0A445C9N6_ARAHY|nr:hypothetical protein Ahy_A07g033599 isoform B [Arachis hypogaea]